MIFAPLDGLDHDRRRGGPPGGLSLRTYDPKRVLDPPKFEPRLFVRATTGDGVINAKQNPRLPISTIMKDPRAFLGFAVGRPGHAPPFHSRRYFAHGNPPVLSATPILPVTDQRQHDEALKRYAGLARKRCVRSSNVMSVATMMPLVVTISMCLEPFDSVFVRATAMAPVLIITG
jgi:hypothetical protein